MLDDELQLGKSRQVLEVLGLGPTTLSILNWEEKVTEDRVGQGTIALAAVVAGSLMNILGSPESAIGNIDVQGQTSTWSTNGSSGLAIGQYVKTIDRNEYAYAAEAD